MAAGSLPAAAAAAAEAELWAAAAGAAGRVAGLMKLRRALRGRERVRSRVAKEAEEGLLFRAASIDSSRIMSAATQPLDI